MLMRMNSKKLAKKPSLLRRETLVKFVIFLSTME